MSKFSIPKRLRSLIWCLLLGGGVYVLGLLGVLLLGPAWHLIHGDFITFQEWRIPVPSGFFVTGKPEQPMMSRYTLGAGLVNVPLGSIGIRTNPSGKPFKFEGNIEDSSSRMIAAGTIGGFVFHSKRTLSTRLNDAYCFEFYSQHTPSEFSVRCAIEGTPVLFVYSGDERFIPDFYSVLEEANGTVAHPN